MSHKKKSKFYGQLLRDIQFSVLVKYNTTINLSFKDKNCILIHFEYVIDKNNTKQVFENDWVKFTIDFMYNNITNEQCIIYCPSFELKVKKHVSSWTSKTHYGQCGQSCPCCRSQFNEEIGSCPICYLFYEKNNKFT